MGGFGLRPFGLVLVGAIGPIAFVLGCTSGASSGSTPADSGTDTGVHLDAGHGTNQCFQGDCCTTSDCLAGQCCNQATHTCQGSCGCVGDAECGVGKCCVAGSCQPCCKSNAD